MFNHTNNQFFVSTFFIFAINFIAISAYSSQKNIAIIVPLEHKSMNEIVEGIKEGLQGTNTQITVKNAQSDSNILLALIKQLSSNNIEIIMPIGSSACQATIAHAKNNKVICVAANISDIKNPLVTGINDEIPITSSLKKLSNIKNIAVIYSANEKVVPEIEELKKYATENNLSLHLRMIQTLVDLPSAVKTLQSDVQAFLLLKDHLVVSGINIIIKESNKRGIPLIASDEGSVINGATIAIGVVEKEIGIRAAAIAKSIINGADPRNIPFETIDTLSIFINSESFKEQKIITRGDLAKIDLPQIEILEKN
jgi:putative ABC transport system substrate-binding protein